MFKASIALALLLSSVSARAEHPFTQVDCGGINETLQASQTYEPGTKKLNYAEFMTQILRDKAVLGWQEGRPMHSNLYISPKIKSVEELSFPKPFTAAYLITISSKNHYPDTRVICTFRDESI